MPAPTPPAPPSPARLSSPPPTPATPSGGAMPDPHLFVVLGATGDLMQRKLLPSIYHLHARGEVPPQSVVLGAARKPMDDAGFQALCTGALAAAGESDAAAVQNWVSSSLRYQTLGDDGPGGPYVSLASRIASLEQERRLTGNRVFYLALPAEAVPKVVQGLGQAGLSKSPGWSRVVVEKPFGRDLASAQRLNQVLHGAFDESQIFRIDHYLGKETVQNLLVLRFANAFIESDWNREEVEDVQITVAESLGVEDRAGYYETEGAMRDMVQNHLTQVLTLVAMEPPATWTADAVRNEKVKVLRSAHPLRSEDVVFGQYQEGSVRGQTVSGYQSEPGVKPGSRTETFVALRMEISNWRWHGVPFFLRTGKRMPAKSTRVVVTFRAPPVSFFPRSTDYQMSPDRLTIMLQPDEGFELSFEIKVPGRAIRTQTHRMRFHYADAFGTLSDGYEALLLDVLRGDPTHFVRADEVEEAWKLFDPILSNPPPVRPYAAGTLGPPEAQRIVEEIGHRWHDDEPPAGS